MKKSDILRSQSGSIINLALLIFVLLVLIGVGLSRLSTTDVKIASNEKADTVAFYEGDAGLDTMSEVLEQNIACATGFSKYLDSVTGDALVPSDDVDIRVLAASLNFWRNTSATIASDTNRDAYYPADYAAGEPHTNLTAGGVARFQKGSAIQMAAGYEGLGKGSGGGGANILFDVYSNRVGRDNSEATTRIQWIHILGLGGADCNY